MRFTAFVLSALLCATSLAVSPAPPIYNETSLYVALHGDGLGKRDNKPSDRDVQACKREILRHDNWQPFCRNYLPAVTTTITKTKTITPSPTTRTKTRTIVFWRFTTSTVTKKKTVVATKTTTTTTTSTIPWNAPIPTIRIARRDWSYGFDRYLHSCSAKAIELACRQLVSPRTVYITRRSTTTLPRRTKTTTKTKRTTTTTVLKRTTTTKISTTTTTTAVVVSTTRLPNPCETISSDPAVIDTVGNSWWKTMQPTDEFVRIQADPKSCCYACYNRPKSCFAWIVHYNVNCVMYTTTKVQKVCPPAPDVVLVKGAQKSDGVIGQGPCKAKMAFA